MQKPPNCHKCSGAFVVKDGGRTHKRPLLLTCGHTFCETCLLGLAKETRTAIHCPKCREETDLPNGESGVKLLCEDRYMVGTNRLIVSEMEPNLQVANLVFKKLKKIDKELNTLVPDCQREIRPVLHDLRAHFHYLHAAQRVMNNNDEVIVNAKEILEKLIHARDIPCIIERTDDWNATDRIIFNAGTPVDALLLHHGEIAEKDKPRYKVHTYREQPEKFSLEELDSQPSTPVFTPLDSLSLASDTTSRSDDIIIEGQNENVSVTHIHSPNKFVVQLQRESSRLTTMSYAIQRWCNSPAANKHMVTEVDVVQEEGGVLMVDLSKPADEEIADDRPISVRDALVFLDLANVESPYSLPEPGAAHAPKRNYLTPNPKDEGESYPVILGEEANYLATMMAHLQDTYAKQNKDSWQIIYPQIGMICVSQFSSDGMWYRARVIELPGNKDVVVHYVDYGNTERVSFFNIRKILDSFLILPAQAIPCCLKDVAQPEEGWTNEVISVESVLGVVLRDPNIEDMYHSINISLVEKDMADSTGRWSAPQNMTELQSSIKEDMDHQPVYWKSRNSKPTRRYEETKLTPPTSPVPLRKSRGQRSGNSDQGPGQRSKRPQKGREQDREEGSSASSGSATPVGRSPRKEVKPKVKSPTSRRSSSSSEKKKKKMVSPDIEDMNKAFQNTEPEWLNLKKGSFCVAFSTSMGRWYRAKVKKVLHKTLMEVYMIDYGFSEVLSDSPEDGKVPIDLVYEEYVQETALEPGIRTFHSIIDRLKEQGLAIPMPKKLTETTKEEKVFPVLYFKKAEAEVKTGDKVMPVYVDFDAVIHCYTMEGDDLFQSMCDSLQQKFKYSDPHGPEQKWIKGQACVAFYEKDQAWHRAAILEVDPEKVVEDSKWDTAVLEMMHRDLVNKYCIITVVEKLGYASEHMTVHLEIGGKDYGSRLVQFGLAQRGEYITDQEIISKQIQAAIQMDQCWYRALIVDILTDNNLILVHFVDYGNSEYVRINKDHSNPTTPVLPETQYVETRNVGKSPVQNVDNCIEHIQANDAISVKSSSAHCEQNLNNRKAASLSSANSVSSEQSVTMGVQSNMVYEFNNEQSESSSALGDSESLSKSWAEMAEEGSTLDYEELPEFETDSERSEQEPIKRASTLGKRELTVAGIDNLNAGAGKTSIQTNINIDKCAEGSLKLNSKDEELSSGEINLVKGGETEVGRKRGKLSEEERKRVKEERRKNREGTKVESVQHDDECFE
ncbi:RNF17-like protein [Mya arenaria]|uniref:RNF17-like protein n=1 Tax=Mya arenaria TaxID=6604 RepID=A0ABY7EIJ9_MYAAR|nr:RNF17-like protein [Mya arenaria]